MPDDGTETIWFIRDRWGGGGGDRNCSLVSKEMNPRVNNAWGLQTPYGLSGVCVGGGGGGVVYESSASPPCSHSTSAHCGTLRHGFTRTQSEQHSRKAGEAQLSLFCCC